MKKLLFGIFAHPDDEAFGPGVYLHDRVADGTDLHLILVTDGESGPNPGYHNLAEVRLEEWHESGRRLGAKSNLALHYPDGGLCNKVYLEIAHKVMHRIHEIRHAYAEPVAIELITFEERGLTGHLDHIAVSFITTYVFEKLKAEPPAHATIGALRYYCLPRDMIDECNCDWIYMPAGRLDKEIDEKHSFEGRNDLRRHIMSAHVSQKVDMETILAEAARNEAANKQCACDNFIVRH